MSWKSIIASPPPYNRKPVMLCVAGDDSSVCVASWWQNPGKGPVKGRWIYETKGGTMQKAVPFRPTHWREPVKAAKKRGAKSD